MNRRIILWSLIGLFLYCTALVLLTGCAGSFTGRAPETRTLTLAMAQPQAYQHAYQVLTQMGTQITAQDGRQALQGVLKGVVLLSVQLQPQEASTLVTVTGSILPGKLTIGTWSELDDLCTRLAAPEVAHGR